MGLGRALGLIGAVLALALAVWRLEAGRGGVVAEALAVPGGVPATLWRLPGAGPAPVVVIAHGFAGSQPMMAPLALALAQAGYLAVTFDFAGHGRNPVPMSGDLGSVEGTTRLLMAEARAVAEAALALPGADGRLAWLGHSMASDIVVRLGIEEARTGAVVAVSMFSPAVTAEAPRNLLVVAGEWEGRLLDEGLRAVRLADPGAGLGRTVGDPAAGTGRRAVAAPGVEHLGVLWSVSAAREARDWLNAAFGRTQAPPIAPRGGWTLVALAAAVALVWPLAGLLPAGPAPAPLPGRVFWPALGISALAAPLLAWPVRTQLLPVLVADYLALHLALMGGLALAILGRAGVLRGLWSGRELAAGLALAAVLIGGFGWVLERYVAAFWPHPGRVAIIVALIPGAVGWMLADAVLTGAGRAGWGRVLAVRLGLIASLGLAVAMQFERLFFLILILPAIGLFLALFGLAGGWVGRRTGAPLAQGLGLGLMLAWALGATFPLVAA